MKKHLLIGMITIYGCASTKPDNGFLIKDTEGNILKAIYGVGGDGET